MVCSELKRTDLLIFTSCFILKILCALQSCLWALSLSRSSFSLLGLGLLHNLLLLGFQHLGLDLCRVRRFRSCSDNTLGISDVVRVLTSGLCAMIARRRAVLAYGLSFIITLRFFRGFFLNTLRLILRLQVHKDTCYWYYRLKVWTFKKKDGSELPIQSLFQKHGPEVKISSLQQQANIESQNQNLLCRTNGLLDFLTLDDSVQICDAHFVHGQAGR